MPLSANAAHGREDGMNKGKNEIATCEFWIRLNFWCADASRKIIMQFIKFKATRQGDSRNHGENDCFVEVKLRRIVRLTRTEENSGTTRNWIDRRYLILGFEGVSLLRKEIKVHFSCTFLFWSHYIPISSFQSKMYKYRNLRVPNRAVCYLECCRSPPPEREGYHFYRRNMSSYNEERG